MAKPLVWSTLALALGALFGGECLRAADEIDITGTFVCRGENPDGGRYQGTVKIAREGDAYNLRWTIAGETHVGLGVRQGNLLSACWGKDGVTGVVVYKIVRGPELMGRWAEFGAGGKVGFDTLTRDGSKLYDLKMAAGPAAVTGDYSCEGENLKGGNYRGQVRIDKEGDAFNLEWTIADKTHSGLGLRFDDTLAAVWKAGDGGGIVVYQVAKGGDLVGRWSELGTAGRVLTETLTTGQRPAESRTLPPLSDVPPPTPRLVRPGALKELK